MRWTLLQIAAVSVWLGLIPAAGMAQTGSVGPNVPAAVSEIDTPPSPSLIHPAKPASTGSARIYPRLAPPPLDPNAQAASPAPAPVPVQERQTLPLPQEGWLDTGSSPAGETSDGWWLQTIVALALVIGLIFLLRFVMQRLGGGAVPGGSVRGLIEVLARVPLGPKTQIVFLKLNERILVVGQTPSGMNTLAQLDDPEEIAWYLGRIEANRPTSISNGFKHLLQRFDKDYRPDITPEDEGGDTSEQYVDRTRDELAGLLSRIRTMKTRSL